MKKYFFFLIMVASLLLNLYLYFSYSNGNKDDLVLNEINHLDTVYKLMPLTSNSDKGKLILEKSLFTSILTIRALGIKFDKLNANQVETLCFITDQSMLTFLKHSKQTELSYLVTQYLKRITPSVQKEITAYQDTFHGVGCKVR